MGDSSTEGELEEERDLFAGDSSVGFQGALLFTG
jgi:hypothetical protein